MDKFELKTLPSGLRLLSLPDPTATSVTILILVAAGSEYETRATSGLSHFLEHMCFKGTTKRPAAIDISQAFDALGASHNAFTSQEFTGYYGTVWPEKVEVMTELLADMYLDPLLDQAEIDKERGVIIEEIKMYEDLPQHRVGELIFELMYGDQPAGWSIAGPIKTVKELKREDFLAYRAKHYRAAKTVVVVSGNFSENKLLPPVEKLFSPTPTGTVVGKATVVENQAGPQILAKEKKSDQTHLVLGWRSFSLFDSRRPTLSVLAGLLGRGMSSRLFDRVRNQLGAAYYVGADQDSYTDHGLFTVAAGVDNERRVLVVETVLEEVQKIKTEIVSEKELRKVKDYLIGNLYLSLETPASLAFYYGGQEVAGEQIQTPKQWRQKLEAVTAQDLQTLANEIFVPTHLNLAVIGPKVSETEFAPTFGL